MLLPPSDIGTCNCCTNLPLLAWHSLTLEAAPLLARTVAKQDEVIGEEGEDAFLGEELAIALLLHTAWAQAAGTANDLLATAVASGSAGNIGNAMNELRPVMSNLFTDIEKPFTQRVETAMQIGADRIMPGETIIAPTRPMAINFRNAIIRAARYATNTYFNLHVVPAILDAVDTALTGTGATTLTDVQAMIARHFRTVPYWGLIANLSASRGYHYGMLRTMQETGVIAYAFKAVWDDRTSDICKALHGRQFLVADALNILDALANDPDPMAGKSRTPWVQPEDIEGLTADQLAAMGVIIPPLHPFCRSTIVPIYG